MTIGEGDKYADAKGKLTAVTFCGTFTKGHNAEECEHYNNLLVIDIDKLDEPGMIYTEECLKKKLYRCLLAISFRTWIQRTCPFKL